MTLIARQGETMTLKSLPILVKVGVPVAAALMAAGCSSASSSTATGTSANATSPASPAATSAGSKTVITVRSGSAGSFLTDGSGRAVYLWVKDPKDKSVCSG